MLLGAAVSSSVLTGALVVGDSVRGSLAALAHERLGRIGRVLIAESSMGERLAGALSPDPGPAGRPAPALLLRGSATHARTRAFDASIRIVAIDDAFSALFAAPQAGGRLLPPGPGRAGQPAIVINEALARELSAAVDDEILLSYPRAAAAPPETILGRRDLDDVAGRLRCVVAGIVPDRGAGRFALSPHPIFPHNVFIALRELQRATGQTGRINTLMFPDGEDGAGLEPRLRRTLDPDDLGLIVARTSGWISIESRELVLRPEIAAGIASIARALGARVQPVQTYLANELRLGGRLVPYSTITAIEPAGPPFPALTLTDGTPAPPLADGEVILNTWAASILGTEPGDTLSISYYLFRDDERLEVEHASLRVAGIARMTGLAADRDLTPDYPGIEDARDIAAWDPPFPVDLSLVGPADESYWDLHGATPKAFVAESTGRRLWPNRFGTTTSIRIAPPEGTDTARMESLLRARMREELALEPFGLRIVSPRHEGSAAAEGATDFGALFLGFSMFLIAAPVLLAAMLFGLGVERRAREVGILLAIGYPLRRVRWRMLAEGLTLAAAGALLGVAGAAGYAGLMLLGLRTIWSPATGFSRLELHLEPPTLAIGGAAGLAVVATAIALTTGRLARIPVPALLAGRTSPPVARVPAPAAGWIAVAGLVAGLVIGVSAVASGATSSPALAFGAGVSILVACLAAFFRWCRRAGRRRRMTGGGTALYAMAARNSSWSPGRSALSVALTAGACFVILTVAASRTDSGGAGHAAGSGGFTLLAETAIPLRHDLSKPEGRAALGLPSGLETLLAESRVVPFRLVPGEDVSCLNLHRPTAPRLLGAPAELIERGGFSFASSLTPADNPWRLLEEDPGDGTVPAIGDENSVRWILKSGLGEELAIRDESGRVLRLRFVALLRRSLFQSEVLIPETTLLERFPGRGGFSFFLIAPPAGSETRVARALEEALSPAGFDAGPVADRLASYHAVENTYLSTFQLLGGLGLLLGTAGLSVVLLRNVLERRGELAALRAIGYPRRRLGALVLAESAFLLLAGVAAGALAAAVAVGPGLLAGRVGPPWGSMAAMLGAIIAAGVAASAAAVRSALRAPLLPALREDR